MILIAAHSRIGFLNDDISNHLNAKNIDHTCAVFDSFSSLEEFAEVEILVNTMIPFGAQEMDAMPKLKSILSPLLGFDWVDVKAATERGIRVFNGEVLENRLGVAESTILLLLAQLFRLHETESWLRDGDSKDHSKRHLLYSRTVGIFGSGGIARLIVERLRPWGCKILISDPYQPDDLDGVTFVSKDTLIKESDAILLMTNLTPDSHHLLGEEEFNSVKPGLILTNTARGGLIDTDALVKALRGGQVASAALDVFEHEPLAADHPLRDLPNVILTPHCLGHSQDTNEAVPRVAATNIELLVNGSMPTSLRNPELN